MENKKYLDESFSFEERAKALVSEMSLKEKVYQTLHGAPAIDRLDVKAYNYWKAYNKPISLVNGSGNAIDAGSGTNLKTYSLKSSTK